jgi:transcriptional regulator of arginine metabolism
MRYLLSRENVAATQATLSRDLRALGVLKGPEGYTLSNGTASYNAIPAESTALASAVQSFLISAKQAGNMVILRTGPGKASALATEIDNALPSGAVGSIAGDDTVFVATASPTAANRITRSFVALAGGR